jgi:hypothetical protein
LSTILFVIVVVDIPDDTRSLLLHQHIQGSIFDEESSEPFESSVKVSVAKPMDLETLKHDISAVKAPADHVGLSNLTNLDKCSDESHFFVSQTGEDDQVSEEENHDEWCSNQLLLCCFSLNLFPPTIARSRGKRPLPLSDTKQKEYRQTICFNLTKFVVKMVKIVIPWHFSKELGYSHYNVNIDKVILWNRPVPIKVSI